MPVLHGEAAHGAKLTDDKVRAIRAELAKCPCCGRKPTTRSVAAKYGIHESVAHKIMHRTMWKHVD